MGACTGCDRNGGRKGLTSSQRIPLVYKSESLLRFPPRSYCIEVSCAPSVQEKYASDESARGLPPQQQVLCCHSLGRSRGIKDDQSDMHARSNASRGATVRLARGRARAKSLRWFRRDVIAEGRRQRCRRGTISHKLEGKCESECPLTCRFTFDLKCLKVKEAFRRRLTSGRQRDMPLSVVRARPASRHPSSFPSASPLLPQNLSTLSEDGHGTPSRPGLTATLR